MRRWALGCVLGTVLLRFHEPLHSAQPAASLYSPAPMHFDIPVMPLVRSAELFGAQSGLQVVYAAANVTGRETRVLRGSMTVRSALNLLLEGTGLRWSPIGNYTVVIFPETTQLLTRSRGSEPELIAEAQRPGPILDPVTVSASPTGMPPIEMSGPSLGFNKPAIETPRTLSVVDSESLERLGQFANDLANVVPAAHTTTRYGVSGTTDVRNVPADVYFRGMKRLTLRGHARKVTAALESFELVGGPAPPIYGMGKLGGYTNVVPKAGRASEGAYLKDTEGFAQLVTGNYDKLDVSFGIGGPMSLPMSGKRGGFYVYGLVEDSGGYSEYVPVEQRLFQAAMSIDEFAGHFRLESGLFMQKAHTAGALVGRLTQDVVDDGTYVRGSPLLNLDADGSGAISYAEMHAGSPVAGQLSAYNQPLMQTFAWPLDAAGAPLPLRDFPRIAGIPRSLHDYLLAHREADPAGQLIAQGVGAPQPVSGFVPLGMAMDPRTVGVDTLDLRRAAAYEVDIDADFMTAYIDLIDDMDPRLTIKNQFFFDGTRHHKKSFQPYAQDQRAYVLEQKLTITSRPGALPEWIEAETLMSLNLRRTRSEGRSSGAGDFANSRTDAMADTWEAYTAGMTANSTFMNPLVEDDIASGGYPWARSFSTTYTERGLGAMIDADLGRSVNLMGGARYDYTSARNVDHAGRFDSDVGTSANPGRYIESEDRAAADKGAFSWSASLSVNLPGGLRPYATFASASLMLDGDDNSLTNAVIRAGHVGQGELREFGIKASLLDRRLSIAAAGFRQARTDVGPETDQALLDTYTTATVTRGWSAEAKWRPRKELSFAGYVSAQSTYYVPNLGGPQQVDAATLGFTDILDADGNVLYPANAFLNGGRAWLLLPDGVDDYAKMQGNPDVLVGLSATLELPRGFGMTAGVNHLSRTCSGRLCTVVLPSTTPVRFSIFHEQASWALRLDAHNIFDERMFRARIDDSLGNVVVRALPDRTVYLTLRRHF